MPRTSTQISTKLFEHARNAAQERNHRFSESAGRDLQQLLMVAGENIVRTHQAVPNSSENALLRMATIIINYIVEQMIEASREDPSATNTNQLEANTLVRAKKKICPVWPFC